MTIEIRVLRLERGGVGAFAPAVTERHKVGFFSTSGDVKLGAPLLRSNVENPCREHRLFRLRAFRVRAACNRTLAQPALCESDGCGERTVAGNRSARADERPRAWVVCVWCL